MESINKRPMTRAQPVNDASKLANDLTDRFQRVSERPSSQVRPGAGSK